VAEFTFMSMNLPTRELRLDTLGHFLMGIPQREPQALLRGMELSLIFNL